MSTTAVKLPPRQVIYVILAGLGMVGPFSIDTIFPAFQEMAVDLHTDGVALQQLISVYMLAFAVMSLLHGPLSDALGRKPVILAGCLLYAAASVGCALAPSLGWLLIARAAQGFTAGAGMIVSRAMLRDIFDGSRAQRVMSTIAMIFGLAPALAPIVGGWLVTVGDWRDIFWFLCGLGGLLFVAVAVLMPETHPLAARTPLEVKPLASSLWQIWLHHDGRRLAIAAMLNFAGMFLYISSAPMFVVELMHKGEQDFWMLFVPLISGMIVGSWAAGRLAGRMSARRTATLGFTISVSAGVLNLALSLIPATTTLPWTVAALPIYSFGVALAYPILTLAMLDLFPQARGAAASVQSFVTLVANAAVAGVLAPLVGHRLWTLAAACLAITVAAGWLWRRHLAKTHREPPVPVEPRSYEPTDEM